MNESESNSMRPEVSAEEFEAMLTEGAGTCPPPELLYAAHEDVLPKEIAGPVLEHSARCSLCRMLLLDRDADEAMEFSPERSARVLAGIAAKAEAGKAGNRRVVAIDTARVKQRRMMFAAIAAGLVVAALVTGARVFVRSGQEVASAPATPVSAASQHREQILAEVANVQPLAAPGERGSDLLTRGADEGAAGEPTSAELLPAFHAYNRGDYATAEKDFAGLGARYPKSALPPLYRGVALLELQENAAALEALKPWTGEGASADVLWYAGVAAARMGDAAAAGLFARGCRMGGEHQAKACALAKMY